MSLPQCTLCAGCLAPWRFLAGWRLGGPRARQWLTYVLCGHCVPCGVLGVSGIDGLFGEASSGCHFGPGVWWARREAAGWDVARGVGMGCHAMCMLGCGSWWETDGWWKWCWRSRCPGDRAGREDRPLPLPQPSPPPTPVTALPPRHRLAPPPPARAAFTRVPTLPRRACIGCAQRIAECARSSH